MAEEGEGDSPGGTIGDAATKAAGAEDTTKTEDKGSEDKTEDKSEDKGSEEKTKDSTDDKSEKKEAKGDDKSDDSSKEDPLRGVPEEGFADATMPDGFVLDDAGAERLKAVGDRFGLSQDGLQEVADFAVGWQQEQLRNLVNAEVQEYNDNIEACMSDKEFGGENYEKNVAAIGEVINRAYGDDIEGMRDFVEAIKLAQVKPAFFRGFSYIIDLIPAANDTFEEGKGKGSKPKSEIVHTSDSSRGNQLYGDMSKKSA